MKTFRTTGTGSEQTLSEIETDKIPIYPTVQDIESDLANLEEGQIVATPDTGNEVAQPVDVVEENNLHAVTSNAVSESLSYSETEQKTGGVWIDGKPIYRKVFNGLTFNVSSSWGNTGYTLQNCDTVINAVVQQLSSSASVFASVSVQVVLTDGTIKVQSAQNFTNCNKIILEYTKTTD